MHILFITDNFPPESNAPANRTIEHAREWVNKGHKVTVITCAPNFPDGRLYKGYKNKWLSVEMISGIHVWRVKTYITANEGFWKRIFDFISFMMSSIFFGIFTKNVDIVIGTSPQFFTIVSSWVLAKIKRVPFVFEVRDLWPAAIVAVGLMEHNKILALIEKLELFLYHQADLIIPVTEDFKTELIQRGISGSKIKTIFNGANLSKYNSFIPKDAEWSFKLKLNDKFVVGYIGTHGMAHAMDVLVEAAKLIKHKKNIRFLLVGAGADRARIKQLVIEHELSNVEMVSLQPSENMPKVWSLCDISLVTIKDTQLFKSMISSRIFESMAMKLPMIISTPEGATTKLIKKTNSGLIVPPENAHKLSEAILQLEKDSTLYDHLADNSLIASKKYNRKNLALEMLIHIEELVR
jgi:glycosyltransferase involved in cell wall biosynthesis